MGLWNLTPIAEQPDSTVTVFQARVVLTKSEWLFGNARCRHPAVPVSVLRGQDWPPWPQRFRAPHLSDSPQRPLSPSSWRWWPPFSPLRGIKSRFTVTVWSCVCGPTAPELGCGVFSLPSPSTWRWQVSWWCFWQVNQANLARYQNGATFFYTT